MSKSPKPLSSKPPEPLWAALHRAADKDKLLLAHYNIQALICYTSSRSTVPFIVLETLRDKAAQEKAFETGHSKARWGQSAHDYKPALAADIAPIQKDGSIDWNDIDLFKELMADVKTCAKELGIAVTCGEDWTNIKDYPHVELAAWKTMHGKPA